MSPGARAWLPPGAIRALDMDGKLADVARGWSKKWFVRSVVRPLEALAAGSPPVLDGIRWASLGGDVAIGLPDANAFFLPALMFDVASPSEPPTAADTRLLAQLSQACLDDLCRRLADALKLDAAAPWRTLPDGAAPDIAVAASWTLGVDPRNPALRIVVAEAALVGMAKAGLPQPQRPLPLAGLSQALSRQAISVSGHIGRCSLTLAEFAGLGVGDVLVFDAPADAPLELVVDGGGKALARCGIAQSDGRLDLILLDSIDG